MTDHTDPPRTASLVAGFARRFDATHLAEHGVGSPLGLWLLLALLAPASTGDSRVDLERVLGTGAEDAAQRAASLLDRPHPAVASAVAVWANELAVGGDGFTAWVASLPRGTETGPVPAQDVADRWAADRTTGGLPSPVEVRERSATIRFNRPFAVVATATGRVPDTERGWGDVDLHVPHWEGVPVFSAWVGEVTPD